MQQSRDISIHAEFGLASGAVRSPFGIAMAWGTTLAILAFDITAGLGAAGIDVGLSPVAAALSIAPFYVGLLCALHHRATLVDGLWTLVALGFGLVYASLVSINYALQLTVVRANPELFAGWTMVLRPDSAFWALEVFGYAYMGLSAAALIPLLRRRGPVLAAWMFGINGVASLLGGGAYLLTGEPGHWLAVSSLIVWGVAFPVGTAVIGRGFGRG